MRRAILVMLAAALLMTACGRSNAGSSGKPSVVTAFYPLEYAVERIAGGRVAITNLSPPGVEPHDLELTPGQVGDLTDADLVVYLGKGFQPAVEDALRDVDPAKTLDALTGQDLIGSSAEGQADPHVWLDPVAMQEIVSEVAAKLEAIDSPDAKLFEEKTRELERALDRLDGDYRRGLADCRSTEIVTAHQAFGYLARRYGLRQVGISGIDPEVEPSPRQVAEVADFARTHGVTTIFFEELLPPDLAETVARDVGVETAVLNPLESRPPQGDYLSAMRTNLQTLREALGCS